MDAIKKHIIPILCILSILLLALPMGKVSANMESSVVSFSSDTSFTGFQALSNSVLTYLLIIAPALLIAACYVPALDRYKGLLAILAPTICIVVLIFTIFQSKGASTSASSEYFSAEAKVKLSIGAFLLFATYIAPAIMGAVTYHQFTLDKAGMEKLKDNAADFLSNAQGKLSETMKNATNLANSIELPKTSSESGATTSEPRVAATKSLNTKRIDEILVLIERLAKMRDVGVLTDEEFAQKKRQLLDEI